MSIKALHQKHVLIIKFSETISIISPTPIPSIYNLQNKTATSIFFSNLFWRLGAKLMELK